MAPEGSDDAHIYRRIPKIARQFAFECSNGCENIFTKEGRKRIVKDSNIYVMTSLVSSSHYKNLQEISKFLKGEEFYDIVGDRSKKAKTKRKIVVRFFTIDFFYSGNLSF